MTCTCNVGIPRSEGDRQSRFLFFQRGSRGAGQTFRLFASIALLLRSFQDPKLQYYIHVHVGWRPERDLLTKKAPSYKGIFLHVMYLYTFNAP